MPERWKAAALAILIAAAIAQPASAGPALLFDAGNGKVLYAEDQDDQWHPASLTKIMTAYLAFEALKGGRLTLEQKIPVSEHAHAQPPSKVGLPVGAEMSVDLALRALIIKSANDVAVMLAETIGGSEPAFVKQMNDAAQRFGMTRTHFSNANGLPDPEQVTTARDLAKLARAVLHDFPEHASLWAMEDMKIGKRRLRTHNTLLKTYEGADGLKTGFICDSGYNVVASATRDGRRLIAVVLGEVSGRDRNVRAASLLEHGFDTYGWKQMFDSTTIATLPSADELKGPTSIRKQIVSWNCGGRKPARKIVKKKAPQKAVQQPKPKAAAAPRPDDSWATGVRIGADVKARRKGARSAAGSTSGRATQ